MIDNIEYSPGMRVLIRNEEWLIKKVETNTLGNKTLYCTGISTLVKDKDSRFLLDLEKVEIINPENVILVNDTSPYFKKSKLYIESQWRQKTPTDNCIHIGDKAAMDSMKYQLTPASIALNEIRQRILIADSTGLGKTLEAGILMSELIYRGKGKRILVVSSKSMMTQFQKEMWNRFSIPLVRLDSTRIQRIRQELPTNYNPFFYYDKTIISIDTLKRDLEYRTHLEKAYWDIIVIDEAQGVAQRGSNSGQSQRSKLAKLLAKCSDTLIMLSATPHDGKPQSFASLMNMLNPTAIANENDYTKDDIKGLCVRRFKKDLKDEIQSNFLDRKVHVVNATATNEEENAFDIFSQMRLKMDERTRNSKDLLFKTSLEKSLFSSPAACVKSIKERIKKLEKRNDVTGDIDKLQELLYAVEDIKPECFSRYIELLKLLKSSEYNWSPKNTKDRIVIFTERIETMKFLASQLRKDFNLDKEIVEIYGGMSDKEQQEIVEDFGRESSNIRILVASDVASEGLNLHYLSHRLIHFDIPWSLMVFQQRNGRIDRYGQTVTPDIRYFIVKSDNDKIKGDTRTLEILIEKEEQAYKNIGDPAMLMNKYSIEEEELSVGKAIENNISEDEFKKEISTNDEAFNPFVQMLQEATIPKEESTVKTDNTLYSDIKYLETALGYFSQTEKIQANKLETVSGIELEMPLQLKHQFKYILPGEIMQNRDTIQLSSNKEFCMQDMKRSMQNSMLENAWPSTQYLWKIHPIFDWLNDKVGLLYNRNEAPYITLNNTKLGYKEFIFIVAGTIPNRKATPIVNEWFGLKFKNNKFEEVLSMEDVIHYTNFDDSDMPNRNNMNQESLDLAQSLLPQVIIEAKKILSEKCKQYTESTEPKIYEELEKLETLRAKKKSYQFSLPGMESIRKKEAKEREIDDIFDRYINWVKDTLEIEDCPYLKVIGVFTGA